MTEIRLPVLDGSGQPRLEEALPAEAVEPGRVRLLASPGLVEGVAAGDELELTADEPSGFRVLQRGGQLCIWVYLPEPPPMGAEERLGRAARALGGYVDGGHNNLRILTVPVTAGFARVETELDAVVAELSGSTWLYGNVYDSRNGGRPLGWWEGLV
jgi:uncharacterized protein DUF4265